MRLAAYGFAVGLLLLAGVVTWTIIRGEDTRRDVRVLKRTVDPCARPQSESCQRRVRLVLRELVKRHPKALKGIGLVPRHTGSKGSTGPLGGDAFGSPTGGGPIGRVPGPPGPEGDEGPPGERPPSEPEPGPLIELDAPLPTRVCVDGVLGVNCN